MYPASKLLYAIIAFDLIGPIVIISFRPDNNATFSYNPDISSI